MTRHTDFRPLTKVIIPFILMPSKALLQALLKALQDMSEPMYSQRASIYIPTCKISSSVKSLEPIPVSHSDIIHSRCLPLSYFCANHARVTTLNFSLTALNVCGLSVMTTTAFCTVLLVTSLGRSISSFASSCRVQLIPNRDRGFSDLWRTRVK